MRQVPDYSFVRAYGDHLNDGLVQLNFTLPVPCTSAGRIAALDLARQMGLDRPQVSHCQQLAETFTHFIIYGYCPFSVDYATINAEDDAEFLTDQEIARISLEVFGRPIVVVGASTGTDTHNVGLDAVLNAKGYNGHGGLESYHAFQVHNLGSQVGTTRRWWRRQ